MLADAPGPSLRTSLLSGNMVRSERADETPEVLNKRSGVGVGARSLTSRYGRVG